MRSSSQQKVSFRSSNSSSGSDVDSGNELTHINPTLTPRSPYVKIVEQPKKEHRFRYATEGLQHGGLNGVNTGGPKRKKTYPTIEIHNAHDKRVVVIASLVMDGNPNMDHVHRFMNCSRKRKSKQSEDDEDNEQDELVLTNVRSMVNQMPFYTNGYYAIAKYIPKDAGLHAKKIEFSDLGIRASKRVTSEEGRKIYLEKVQKIALIRKILETTKNSDKKEVHVELTKNEIAEINGKVNETMKMLKETKKIAQVVRIAFDLYVEQENEQFQYIDRYITDSIFNAVGSNKQDLKICHISHSSAPWSGKRDIYILCDKVQNDDIEVIFRDTPNEIALNMSMNKKLLPWEKKAYFKVHHQVALIVQVPQYKTQNIPDDGQKVEIILKKKSKPDIVSDPVEFIYVPEFNLPRVQNGVHPHVIRTLEPYETASNYSTRSRTQSLIAAESAANLQFEPQGQNQLLSPSNLSTGTETNSYYLSSPNSLASSVENEHNLVYLQQDVFHYDPHRLTPPVTYVINDQPFSPHNETSYSTVDTRHLEDDEMLSQYLEEI